LLHATLLDSIHPHPGHDYFDKPALLLPRDRLVEPFSEIRQEGLRRADVPGDGVRSTILPPSSAISAISSLPISSI
jgi:hypothetical protein